MLTYATLGEFKRLKQIEQLVNAAGDATVTSYLLRATRFIDRYTRREFFPWRETRNLAIPSAFMDLRMRRFLSADLPLDADLLEVESLLTSNDDELTEGEHFFTLPPNIYPKAFIALKSPNLWTGSNGNTFRLGTHFKEPILTITALWGYSEYYNRGEAWIDTEDVIKVSGLTASASDNEITVNDVDAYTPYGGVRFEKGKLLKMGNEMMIVKDNPDAQRNRVPVQRAARGTELETHDIGDSIYSWRVHEDIVEATIQVAKTFRESDVAAGGRLGVSDISAGVEISIPADPLNIIKSYVRSSF